MIRLAMLAAAFALLTGPTRACQAIDDDPAELRPCGMPWSTYYERRQADVERQYRSELDADQNRDGGRRRRR